MPNCYRCQKMNGTPIYKKRGWILCGRVDRPSLTSPSTANKLPTIYIPCPECKAEYYKEEIYDDYHELFQ